MCRNLKKHDAFGHSQKKHMPKTGGSWGGGRCRRRGAPVSLASGAGNAHRRQ